MRQMILAGMILGAVTSSCTKPKQPDPKFELDDLLSLSDLQGKWQSSCMQSSLWLRSGAKVPSLRVEIDFSFREETSKDKETFLYIQEVQHRYSDSACKDLAKKKPGKITRTWKIVDRKRDLTEFAIVYKVTGEGGAKEEWHFPLIPKKPSLLSLKNQTIFKEKADEVEEKINREHAGEPAGATNPKVFQQFSEGYRKVESEVTLTLQQVAQ